VRLYHPSYRYRGTGELRRTGTWWVSYYKAGRKIRRRATREEIAGKDMMNLQPVIDELMTKRELIKQKLKDIEDAIPVLQRLNNEMSPAPIPNVAANPSPDVKYCNRCKTLRPIDQFPLHTQCIGGRANTCKVCKREEDIKRKQKAKEAHSGSLNEKFAQSHTPSPIVDPPNKVKIVFPNPVPDDPVCPVSPNVIEKYSQRNYVCEICHCTFKTYLALDSHNALLHPVAGEPAPSFRGKHKCSVCSKKFHTDKGLQEHIELRHPKENEEVI